MMKEKKMKESLHFEEKELLKLRSDKTWILSRNDYFCHHVKIDSLLSFSAFL